MTKAEKLLDAVPEEDFILVNLESMDGWELTEIVSDDGKTPNYFLDFGVQGFLVLSNKPIDKAAAKKFFDSRWQKI